MGHTVERRPRGAGRPPSTHPSRGYRSATRVHVQARLRMQDASRLRAADVYKCLIALRMARRCAVQRPSKLKTGISEAVARVAWNALRLYVARVDGFD